MKNKKGTIFAKAAALVAAVIMSVTAFAACNSGEQLAYGKELLTLNTQL